MLTFEFHKIRPNPIGIFGAIGIFLFVFFLEGLIGSVFYVIGGNFGTGTTASIIINIGIWVTKLCVLYLIYRWLTEIPVEPSFDADVPLEERAEPENNWFSNWIPSKDILKFFLLTLGLITVYRICYDNSVGLFVMNEFGVDPELIKSFELILGAPMLGLVYMTVVAPIYEEIVYRGILYGGLVRKGMGYIGATFISSFLFGLMHMNVAQGVNAFFLGILAAFAYQQTGNLLASILLHMINNVYAPLFSYFTSGVLEKIPMAGNIAIAIIGMMVIIYFLVVYKLKAIALDKALFRTLE